MDNITDEPEIVKQLKHEEKLGLFHNRAKSQYGGLESVEKSSNIGLDEPDVFAEDVDTNDVIGGNLNDKQDVSNLFETIANTTSDFICLTKFKMNPTYVYVNPSYESVLGYTPDEMIGKSTWDFVHPDDKKNLMPLLKKYLGMKVKKLITRKETTISENFESSIRDKSGNWHYLESTANIIGENLLFISKDVTERKKAEETLKESEEKFKSLYFSMNEGVCLHEIIYDKYGKAIDYKILDANPSYEKITGLKKEDVIGCIASKLYMTNNPPYLDRYSDVANTGNSTKFETYFPPMEKHFSISVFSPKKGKFATIFSDITERKKAEEELMDAKSHFQTLFNLMVDPVVIIDSKGKFLDVTDRVKEITGYDKDELIGKNFLKTKILTKKSKAVTIKNLMKRMAGMHVSPYEIEVVHKDGTILSFEINAQKIDYKGISSDMICFRDVAERKKNQELLENERKQMLSIFDGIGEIIYVADPKTYEILYANPPLKKAFNKNLVGEICYKSLQNRDSPCDFCTNEIILNNNGKPYHWQYHNPIIDKIYNVIDKTIKWPDGRDVRFELAIDITNQKKAEIDLKDAHEQLTVLNEELEQKVKDRTADVNALLEQKDDFIHMLSHDLKNPLTPMLMLLPIIEKREKDPELKQMIQNIIRSAKTVKELITQTLTLAKLNDVGTTINLKNINVLNEVNAVLDNNKMLLDNNDVDVENLIDKKIFVNVDKLNFDELINNFITNAVKYTSDSSRGKIAIDAHKKQEEIIISIKDNGVGLSENQLDCVFEKFYKTNEARSGMESSGLGLTICKNIIDKHHGKIWVESPGKGKGSTFYFTLKAGGNND